MEDDPFLFRPCDNSFASFDGKTKNDKLKIDCWSDRNGIITPIELAKSTHKKYWFDCDTCPHDFESALCKITTGRWCPYCCKPSRKICLDSDCEFCFNKSFASFDGKTENDKLKVDCWSDRNGIITPIELAKLTGKKFWFDCDTCPHDFESALSDITNGTWCPYCTNKKRCLDNDCKYCFNKSFASFDGKTENDKLKIDCWSDRNKLKPRDITKETHKKFWFDCDTCPHDFESRVQHITGGSWCPYCCKPSRKLCSDNDCKYCLNNSFASFDGKTENEKLKVDCWSDKNEITPRDVSICNGEKYWFDCDTCPHDFEKALCKMTGGSWCPYCVNQKLCLDNDCKYCFNKSFASFDGKTINGILKVDCWSDRNEITPREVTKCSGKKFWFNCDKCNYEFNSIIGIISKGCWCPKCRESKGEVKISLYIKSLGFKDNAQIKFKDCKNINQLPFDNAIINDLPINILIEYDGELHFKSVEHFGGKKSYKQRIKNDIIKNKYCLENKIILLRIAYTDYEHIEKLIDRVIILSNENKYGIIYSNPILYQTCYFPTWKRFVINNSIFNLIKNKISRQHKI